MAATPWWRQGFDAWERTVAANLDHVMRTELFARVLADTTMAGVAARRRFERLMRDWLRLWNLPTGSDLQHLHDLVLSVDRRLRDLAARLDDLDAATRDTVTPPDR